MHCNYTVELPNNGHLGSKPFVLYIEVVLHRSGDKVDPDKWDMGWRYRVYTEFMELRPTQTK